MRSEDAHFHFVCTQRADSRPDALWNALSRIDQWPDWAPGIRAARLDGALLPGAGFRWRSGLFAIRSTLLEVRKPQRLSWLGRAPGIQVRHDWTFEPQDGATLVRSEEWVRSLWPLRGQLRRGMEQSVAQWLDALVRRARQEACCDD